MSYVTTISLPITFEADSDEQARLYTAHLAALLARLSLPHDAEIYDAPHIEAIEESIPYEALRLVPEQDGPYTVEADDDGCAEERDATNAIYAQP